MSLRQAIDDAAARLAAAGVDSARVDAELLAAHAAGTERGRLMFADLPSGFEDRFRALVTERAKRIPLQHLTGTAAFGPVQLHVGPGCSSRGRRPSRCWNGFCDKTFQMSR